MCNSDKDSDIILVLYESYFEGYEIKYPNKNKGICKPKFTSTGLSLVMKADIVHPNTPAP